jgi:hypothetical protein
MLQGEGLPLPLEERVAKIEAVLEGILNLAQAITEHLQQCPFGDNIGAVDARIGEVTEGLSARVATLESFTGKLNGHLFDHDKTFRALGADMIARANGGGSVAPPAPSSEKPI